MARITIRCERSEREALEKLAEKRGTSLSAQVRQALRMEALVAGIASPDCLTGEVGTGARVD